jgi:hypothetical protein
MTQIVITLGSVEQFPTIRLMNSIVHRQPRNPTIGFNPSDYSLVNAIFDCIESVCMNAWVVCKDTNDYREIWEIFVMDKRMFRSNVGLCDTYWCVISIFRFCNDLIWISSSRSPSIGRIKLLIVSCLVLSPVIFVVQSHTVTYRIWECILWSMDIVKPESIDWYWGNNERMMIDWMIVEEMTSMQNYWDQRTVSTVRVWFIGTVIVSPCKDSHSIMSSLSQLALDKINDHNDGQREVMSLAWVVGHRHSEIPW